MQRCKNRCRKEYFLYGKKVWRYYGEDDKVGGYKNCGVCDIIVKDVEEIFCKCCKSKFKTKPRSGRNNRKVKRY